jgi:hypothetical protein
VVHGGQTDADGTGSDKALVRVPRLNGLRVFEACRPNVEYLDGSRYQPTLRIVGRAASQPGSRCTQSVHSCGAVSNAKEQTLKVATDRSWR